MIACSKPVETRDTAMKIFISSATRWALALLTAFALLVCASEAQAATYNYTFPSQTWGRPPANSSNCNGAKTTSTYATLTISLYGAATITATRATGSGIYLTTYQGSVFPTQQCVNFWDTTNSGTTSVSRTLSYSPGAPFNYPSTFVIVVSGNGPADLANFTVTTTLNSGTTLNLVCNAGTFSPDTIEPTSAGGTFSSTYTPPVGAIGCNTWTATSADSWVHNLSPASGTGTQSISFTVDANSTGSTRYSEIDIGSAAVYIDQVSGPSCSYSLSPTSASVATSASSGSFAINTTAGCAWTATTASSFVSGVTALGVGSGTVNYSVAANTGPARSATITAGGQTHTINQPSGCTYAISPTSAAPGAAGGTASVTVTPSNAACAWTATSNSAFLTGVTASGTGTGTLSYTVGANTGIARTGTITIAGQTFTVNQASGCTFTVTPTSLSPSAAAGSGSLAITASNPACPWTAANNDSWLAISPTSGTGASTATYTVAANAGPARTGSLTVAGQTISVSQASGCSASLSGAGLVMDASGGSGSVTLTMSSPSCAWSATSNSPWVTVPATGTGTTVVNFTVAAQVGPARIATLTIAGQTFSVEQSSGCTYAIAPSSASVGTSAGTGSVAVTASNPACTWGVTSNASWLASTSSGGTGNQSVPYDFTANTGAARTGSLTIAGKTFNVTQASGCTASLSPSSLAAPATGSSSSFTITMSNPTCTWTAGSPDGFITGVTASGTGSGSVAFAVSANSGPARSGTIVAGGSTFSISQASGCTASLGASSANAPSTGSSSAVALTMSNSACPWTASSNASWLTVTASGSGSGNIAYTAAANTAGPRTGTLTIAGQTFTVQQGDGCAFTLSTTQIAAVTAGQSGSLAVTASAPSCAFTASSQAPWITGVTAGATGSATVNYTVAANTGSARSGTLTVAGQTVTINQATGCVASLTTQSVPVSANGGSTTIGIAMSSPGCTWTAAANDAFITGVTAGGTGSGSVTFNVSANVGIARTGTLTIAGQTVSVSQANGCTFLLNPTGAALEPQTSGPLTFSLSASDPTCPWTMQGHDSWVVINTPSGTGSSTLSYSAAANLGPARSSSIDVGGRTFSIVQDEGCQRTVTPEGTINVSAAAQTTQFHLAQSSPSCTWTATSSNSWLTVVDTAGTGDSDVHLNVEANMGPERTLQVQLKGGQSVTVKQASGCTVSLPAPSASAFASGGPGSFNVNTAGGCAYTATTSAPWITGVTVTAQGVSYAVAPSTETLRTGTITVQSTSTGSSAAYTVTQSSGCVLVLSSAAASPAAEGGPASFTVQTSPGCQFTATTTDSWLQPLTVTNDTISYQSGSNVGPARNGTIAVTSSDTGVTTIYAVSQVSGCKVEIATQDVSLTKAGGPGSFGVTTGEGCAINVSSADNWLSGLSYTQGVASFVAAANSDTTRVGTIVVRATDTGASATFTVNETSGCTVSLPVASAEVGISGGNVAFDVTTGSGCTFSTNSGASWISNIVETETGVSFSAEDNTGIARTTTLTVTATDTGASTTYIVHQAGAITTPVIGTQPAGKQLLVGQTLRIEVVASGGDLHYQWRKDGVDIPDATSVEYRVLAATVEDSGSYDVVITNAAGSVTSAVAVVVVSVEGPPGGNMDPDGGAAGAGGDAGAANGGNGTGGAPSGGAPSENAGAAGEANVPSGTGGGALPPPFVGGGDCSCSVVGGGQHPLAAAMLGLLGAVALMARRRRPAKRGQAD